MDNYRATVTIEIREANVWSYRDPDGQKKIIIEAPLRDLAELDVSQMLGRAFRSLADDVRMKLMAEELAESEEEKGD